MKLPKIELHVHLEGTITPAKARELSARNNIPLPKGTIKNGQYNWADFIEMVTKCYDGVASTLRTKRDYEEITYEYLAQSAKEGVIYTELIVSPDHALAVGLSYPDMLDAVARGIDRARQEHGIESRMLAVIVRHLGSDHAEKTAQMIVDNPHPYLVGVNLAGDEVHYPARDFAKAFEITRKAGLPASIHAGEAAGPESVYEALDVLGAKRIGHGVRSIEDQSLIERLIADKIILEVAPSSNVEIGVYPDYESHPLRKLYDAGVRVTINSDDPPFFYTTIGREYALATEKFGLSEYDLLDITRNALEGSFADDGIKAVLRRKLEIYEKKTQKLNTVRRAKAFRP